MAKRTGRDQEGVERRPQADVEDAPALDEAGGVSRDELDPRRFGARPVKQNDRTRDRELTEPTER